MNKITATKGPGKPVVDNSLPARLQAKTPPSGTSLTNSNEDVVEIDTNPTVFGPGMWFVLMSMAARVRTPTAIENFISFAVPVMANLLCSTCARHSRKNLVICHPSNYLDRVDHRGENIGMWLWVYDFHNQVNLIANPPKSIFPLDHALAIYEPILRLTIEEIEDDYENAQTVDTVDKIHHFSFVDDDDVDVTDLEPAVAEKYIPPVVKPISSEISTQRTTVNNRQKLATRRGHPQFATQPCMSCGTKK